MIARNIGCPHLFKIAQERGERERAQKKTPKNLKKKQNNIGPTM